MDTYDNAADERADRAQQAGGLAIRLNVGRRYTGITIIPWLLDPKLWAIRWPDGLLSPPGNFTRAKEAAIMFARQQPGFGWKGVHQWEGGTTRFEGPRTAEIGLRVSQPTPTTNAEI